MTSRDNELSHELRLNGHFLMTGDALSIAVIFNNLSGRNFREPPTWRRDQTYAQYIAYMENVHAVIFEGGKLELAPVGKPAEETHSFVPTTVGLNELYAMWDRFADVAMAEDGEHLGEAFLEFEAGTHREAVWRWFESQNMTFVVGEALMGMRAPIEDEEATESAQPAPV